MYLRGFGLFCLFTGSVVSSPIISPILRVRQRADAASSQSIGVQVEDIWDFPKGTWVENLAVRGNGKILTTLLTSPQVYQVDPDKKAPATLVHTFNGFRGCLGIVEQKPDIFYVVVGNGTFQIFPDTAGSFTVFKLDVSKFVPGGNPATVTKVASFPQSSYFNGITTTSPSSNILLIADSGAGAVWSLNVDTAATAKVSTDPLFSPTSTPPTGVNGVKVRQSTLFFTNTQQQIYGSAPIDTATGAFTGTAKAVNSGLAGLDDFQLDAAGDTYFAGNDQLRLRPVVGTNGQVIVASSDPLLQGSTAVQFGRRESDRKSLYVSTRGPIAQYQSGTFTTPGRVVRASVTIS